ncbi:MAG: serine/threonine protein kinase, partial [Myxococcota bacterium]|nr:serine/threonine protein kinase [Myxococcota bacterium]
MRDQDLDSELPTDPPTDASTRKYVHPPGSDLTLEVDRLIAGRYRVESRLARGGQAAVYLAHQEPLNRPVAL